MFSDNYKIFKGIKLGFNINKGDFVTIKNNAIVIPMAGETIKTLGVVKQVNSDGTIDILVRNSRGKEGFNRDIDFWEGILSNLKEKKIKNSI